MHRYSLKYWCRTNLIALLDGLTILSTKVLPRLIDFLGSAPCLCWQVLLSAEDQRMMVHEVAGRNGTIDLRTFLLIMEHSSW